MYFSHPELFGIVENPSEDVINLDSGLTIGHNNCKFGKLLRLLNIDDFGDYDQDKKQTTSWDSRR